VCDGQTDGQNDRLTDRIAVVKTELIIATRCKNSTKQYFQAATTFNILQEKGRKNNLFVVFECRLQFMFIMFYVMLPML